MNKQDLIKKINKIQDISREEKAYLIDLVNTKKKYGLVWENKPEDVEEQLRSMLPVFKEVHERAIISEDKTAPNHILIEGDNLHALTALTYTHEEKIDIIYIDPPYNTGKENEFRYNDKWILKEDPFRHSTWLNFVSKRLRLAKTLLNKTGVCIIHIDENEFDALNLLLETEIFMYENFLGVIIWNKQNPKGDAKGVATMHEYLLVYCKNKEEFSKLENSLSRVKPNADKILNKARKLFGKIGKTLVPEEISEVIKPFNYDKETVKDFEVSYDLELVNKEFQAWLKKQEFSGGEKAYRFIDEQGDVFQSVSMAWPNKEKAPDDYFIPLIHPITTKECPLPARGWRNPSATMKRLLEKDLIIFGRDENTQPRRKYLLKENLLENTPSIYNNGSSDDEFFKEIQIEFPYPKTLSASKYFIQSIHPDPKIVMDFFAGSGTTLHATMALNAEDGGNRQCILVTNNENNIAEEVTYQRNKRVIQGYTNAKGDQVEALTNNNLRYYQSDFIPSARTEVNRRLLTARSTELLCIKENCYHCITADFGINPKQAQLFTDLLGRYMVVVYHSRSMEAVVEKLTEVIQGLETTEKVKIYAFSPEKDSIEDDFFSVQDKIETVPLPDSIYNAYRATFRTLKLSQNQAAASTQTQDN